MLVPQGIAYSLVAGLPPVQGLYCAIIPVFVYALFGTSGQLAVGPVALVSLLTYDASRAIQPDESAVEEHIGIAISIAFVAGLIYLVFFIFRLGFVTTFLSHSVILGFTTAAGILIGLGQIKHILGVKVTDAHYIWDTIAQLVKQIGDANGPAVAIGVSTIVILFGVKFLNKWLRRRYKGWRFNMPGPLLVVVLFALISYGADLNGRFETKIIGDIPSAFPAPTLPKFEQFATIAQSAVLIVLVGFMESVSVAKNFAREKGYEIDSNQELLALGLANLLGALFQSYAVAGGISRSAVASSAGAHTPGYGIVVALFVVIAMLVATDALFFLPNAVLGGIIIVACSGLLKIREFIELVHVKPSDALIMAIAVIFTLLLGVEIGLVIAIALSLLIVIHRSSRPHNAVLGRIKGTAATWRNVRRFPTLANEVDGVLVWRFDASLFFANADYFQQQVYTLLDERNTSAFTDDDDAADVEAAVVRGDRLRAIIFDFSAVNDIDATALHSLAKLVSNLQAKRKIAVCFATVKGPVRDSFVRGHIASDAERRGKMIFSTIERALHSLADRGLIDADAIASPRSGGGGGGGSGSAQRRNSGGNRRAGGGGGGGLDEFGADMKSPAGPNSGQRRKLVRNPFK